jgi:hypothetical protein
MRGRQERVCGKERVVGSSPGRRPCSFQRKRAKGRTRYDFEDKILGSFNELDDALRSVRRSRIMNKLRASQVPDDADRSEIEKLFANVKAKHTDLNIAMCEFAHIAMPGRR